MKGNLKTRGGHCRVAGRQALFVCLCALCFLFALFIPGIVPPALSEEETAQVSNLEKINEQVNTQNAELQAATQRYQELDKTLRVMGSEVAQMRKREASLVADSSKLSAERTRLEGEHSSAQARIVNIKELAARRLRSLYMHGTASLLEKALLSAGNDSFGRMVFYLSRLSDFDRDLVTRIHGLISDNQKRRAELLSLSEKQSKLIKAIADQRKATEGKLKAQQAQAAKLREEKTAIEEVLTALKAQALRLETVMVSMTDGSDDNIAVSERRQQMPSEDMGGGKFEGEGLFRQKGSLTLPVRGEILQKYGRSQAAGFEDFVFSKGVEFGAAAGVEVSAIAEGQVLFVGRMPAYGMVVIVDHGQRYYSLYGRLGEPRVVKGQIISKGGAVGLTSQPDNKSRNLYFEIRRNGTAVDPADYFKRLH